MADRGKPASFVRAHGGLWYRSLSYRLAWLTLPQAIVALVIGVFFMGGGIGDLSLQGGAPQPNQTATDWATPLDIAATEEVLDTLRDAAAEGDKGALAELEAVAEGGDIIAAFKLGTLYSPYFAKYFPLPAQKDVAKAIALYEPAANAGFWKAHRALGEIYLVEARPLQNKAKGCENMIAYFTASEIESMIWGPENIHDMVNGANCLLNELLDDGVAFTEPSKQAAEQALGLLENPVLANDTLALSSRVRLLIRPTSPVYDVKRACPAAEAWVELTTPESRNRDDLYILTFLAQCHVGAFDEPLTRPPKARQLEAVNLLSAPELKNVPDAQANLAWLLLYPWDVKDAVAGCAAAENWAALVGNDQTEISRQNPLTGLNFADCLLGVFPGQAPRNPSPQEMEIVHSLANSAIERGYGEGDYMLGQIYRYGTGGAPVSGAKAVQHFEACATTLPDCSRHLGDIHAYALIGHEKDNAKAVAYYKLCADAGMVNCDAQLSNIYRFDSSFSVPDEEVVGHMRKAAEAGETLAAENLAYTYYQGGFGLKADMEAAAGWLIKAIIAPGGESARDWLANNADQLKKPEFWVSMHRELARLGAYSGKVDSKPTPETVAALYKLK